MPDAGSAIVKVDFDIQYGDLTALENRITNLENKAHTIKVKVEAVDGQKGLNNLINGLDKSAKNFSRKTSTSAKSANTEVKAVTESMLEAEKVRKNASKQLKKDNSDAAKSYKAVIDKELQSQKIWQNMNKVGALSNKQLQQNMDESSKRIIEADKNYQSFIKTRNEQIRQDKNAIAANKLVEKTEAQRNKQIEQRGNLIEKERVAQEKAWDSRKATVEKQEDKWNKQFKQAGKPYEKEIKEYERLNSKVSEDSKARWNAQRQVMSDEARLSKEINSWTAARHGKTSADYNNLIKSREEMARLHDELERGEITWKKYEDDYRKAASAASKAENNILREGKNTLSFGDKVKSAFSELSRYVTPAMVLREGIQAVKQMAQASMEIESAMTRIQIVTGSTDSQMTQFFDTASNQAQELGKNITDVAGSIETFSRLGFNLGEAENLSKFATIMSNVADTSIDEATTGLTSIIKGFGLEAKDAEHVSDVLIDVGQKYAISASELMQSFERGGAALHASGASFEESAALFAATNAALQNASTTGTMWKTVSARLRGATSELKDMGEETDGLAQGLSKYRDELIQLSGVDIMKNASEYKNPYQIFTELAENWDKINGDPAKARVAEILGGTRQLSGIMSTITNIKDAMGAYQTAMDSAGVAAQANDKYMETTATHVGQLKAAFQELSYDTLNGDLMKGVVDFGKGSLNAIDAVVDHVGTLGTAIAGVGITSLIKGIKQYKSIASSLPEGTGALEGVFGFTNAGAVAIGAGAITAAIAIYKEYQRVQEEQRQQALAAGDTYKSTISSLDEYSEKIVELKGKIADSNTSEAEAYDAKKQLLEIQSQLTEEYGKSAEALNLLNDSEQQSMQNILEMKREAANELLDSDVEGYEDAERELSETRVDDLGSFLKVNSKEGKAIEELARKYDGLISVTDDYFQGVETGLANLTFGGTAEQEVETLSNFMEDLRKLRREVERDGGNTGDIDYILGLSSDAKNRANEVLNKYQDIIDAHKEAEFMADDTKYFDKSAIEWLEAYKSAIEDYNEALDSGDPTKIQSAAEAFEKVDNVVQALLGNTDMGKYLDFFDEIGDQLNEGAIAANNFNKALNKEAIANTLSEYGKGGNVDLTNRPKISTKLLSDAGWEDVGEGYATVFTSTFSNAAAELGKSDGIAINFTPIITDENGNYVGVLGPKTLQTYAEGVISGAHDDYLNLQVGAKFTGSNAINDAAQAAEFIHEQQELYYSDLMESADAVKSLNMSATDFADTYLDIKNSDPRRALTNDEKAIMALTRAAKDFGYEITDASGALSDEFLGFLQDIGVLAEDASDSIKDLNFSLSDFSDYQSNLKSAIDSSLSSTGMTEEQITALSEAYKDLEGYDPARLFENTMHGVKLNTDEMKRLNEQVEQNHLSELYQKLSEQNLELYKAKNAGDDISAIQNEIAATEQLIAQYQGMISSYNAWLTAKSAGTHKDAWESLGSEYQNMAKLAEEGRVGNDALNAYLDTMLGEHRSNTGNKIADVAADLEQLNATVEGTSHSLLDYFSPGDSGFQGLQWFLDDMHSILGDDFVSLDEEGGYAFDFSGEKLDILTDKIKGGREAIELLADALREYGYEVNLGEDSYGEQIENAKQQVEELQQSGVLSKDIELGIDVETAPLNEVANKIQQLRNERAEINPEVNPKGAAALDDLISACEQEYYLRLNVDTEGGLDQAVSAVNEINSIITQAQGQNPKISISAVVHGSARVQELAGEIASLPPEVQIAVGVNAMNIGDAEGIVDQLSSNPGSITVPINYEQGEMPSTVTELEGTANYTLGESPTEVPDASGVANFTLGSSPTSVPSASGTANYKLGSVPTVLPPATQLVIRRVIGGDGGKAAGTMTSIGVAKANGTAYNGPWNWKSAYANGNITLPEDEIALVNELGTESIIRDGQWMLLPGGMHTEALKKGDIVLSAKQTKALLTSGQALGHGRAYADGTIGAALMNAYISGSGPGFKSIKVDQSSNSSNSGSKSSGGGNNNSDNKSEDEEPEIFDWIELAIDRIERAIKQLGITAKSTFKTLTTRLEANAEEIKTVTDEIELQQKAYDRYIQQADSVGLSDELAERVRNGVIDINEYDKETQELINKYKEWYEKALDCDDAIQQLHEDLGQLYEDRFTDTKDDFDAQLDMLEHMTNTFENGMDDIEARGYLMTTKYYEAMRDVERQNIDVMNKELDALTEKMSQAVNSGEIKEGSQAWYDMQRDINDVKEAIQEAETSVIEFGNSIRETLWDRFDYLQDRITEITDEAEFMIDLMDFSKLYDDQGQLTNTGMATMGLHGMNYNVMMNQADRYAAEIKKINKELANDPYNTKLLEQRQEWIESQRESILNAEEEKQAIVDMVEEGIRLELDALNEVINKYKESLDTAKSLADYQKKVKEQSDNISTIQKRISAYAGDNSEESRSTIQKLNTDLTKAIETLQDTQENRRISETKEMLSNLYDQYEMTLNQRLDDVDALISDMISTINSNAGNIDTTIKNEAKDVGYTLSEAMRNIWTTDGKVSSVITLYGDNFVKFGENFNGALTTVNEVILRIAEYVAKMAGVSDKEAKARIKETTPTTKTNKAAKPVTPPAPKKVNKPVEKKQDAHTDQEKYGVAIAIWNGLQGWGGGQDRKNKLESKGFNYDEIQGIVNKIRGDILSNSWSGKYYGITGADIPKYAYNKFKSGGIVDYTGLAQVDGTPGRPESFLNAKDTYNFTVLKDLLDKAIHGGNHGIDLFAGITGISKPNGIKNSMFGDITYQINIPIDHVENYDDFVNKMRSDGKFEKLIQSMTIDQMAGRGSLSKNKYKW